MAAMPLWWDIIRFIGHLVVFVICLPVKLLLCAFDLLCPYGFCVLFSVAHTLFSAYRVVDERVPAVTFLLIVALKIIICVIIVVLKVLWILLQCFYQVNMFFLSKVNSMSLDLLHH